MRFWVLGVTALATVVLVVACGGGGSSSSTSANPVGPSSGGTTANATVTIVGSSGPQSFNPNPAEAGQGSTVAWKNNDGVTHHIVLNDGSLDTGDIAPGASSRALRLTTDGANYHCTIHPTMVGSIKTSSGTVPPCQGQYC